MFHIAETLNEAHFAQMEALEKRFYSDAFITPAGESYAYYRRFPLSTVAAMDEDCVIGFINLFPVREEIFNGILRGAFNDSSLTHADIVDVRAPGGAPLHMFLSCIAVERAYRRLGATGALLNAAVAGYADHAHRCDYVVTDNVTEEGRRLSERLGFTFACESGHGSIVYVMPYDRFANAVLTG